MYLSLGMPYAMFSYNIWTMHVHCVFVFPSAAKPTATVQPAKEQFLISPITVERIPASKMADHMRYGMWYCIIISSSLWSLLFIGLLDPRWREQQNKTVGEKKQQDEIFAVGM